MFKTPQKLTGPILIVGCAEKMPDLRYVIGFSPVDPVVLLLAGQKGFLVVPALEAGRAARHAHPRLKILTPQEILPAKAARRDRGAWALALARKVRVRAVLVPPDFPVGLARELEAAGLRVTVAAVALFPGRRKKNAAEVKKIRESQRAATRAMKKAVGMIRRASVTRSGQLALGGTPLTSERVRRAIEITLLENGAMATETIVAGGRQGADPHERGAGALRAGQPIVLDIFPRHQAHGYWGDLTRTVVKGRASDAVRRMHTAVKAAHAAALSEARAGQPVGVVHAAACAALESRGFKTAWRGAASEGFIHNTGHGVGLEIHEAPTLGEGETRLAAGDVVTIEPGLYYRRLGGVRIEDTVLVTKRGARVLDPCPYYFEV